MLSVEEARARCEAAGPAPRLEEVGLDEALGRVLARDLDCPGLLPPWDNSAMDGYALRAADTCGEEGGDCCDEARVPGADPGVALRVLETIPAGGVGRHEVVPGTCARIMTGAPLPRGADAVVMREDTELLPGSPEAVLVRGRAAPGQHIRRAGSELGPGDRLLSAGSLLGPGAVGLLAGAGLARVPVWARPRVAVIGTGDELVAPGLPLGPGQIHASNSQALCGWIEQAGGLAIDCGVAPDTLAGTVEAFGRALAAKPDLLISTGGVSVGDFDFVKEAFSSLGVDLDFWKVRMKPGKPLAFGHIGAVPIFGLPGNPVSCQVNFLQFVRPVLRRAAGDPRPYLPVLPVRVLDGFGKRPGRAELVRLCLRLAEDGSLEGRTTGDQGSGQGSSMAWAQGLALLGVESEGFKAGERVPTQIFDWSFAARAADPTPWGAG